MKIDKAFSFLNWVVALQRVIISQILLSMLESNCFSCRFLFLHSSVLGILKKPTHSFYCYFLMPTIIHVFLGALEKVNIKLRDDWNNDCPNHLEEDFISTLKSLDAKVEGILLSLMAFLSFYYKRVLSYISIMIIQMWLNYYSQYWTLASQALHLQSPFFTPFYDFRPEILQASHLVD